MTNYVSLILKGGLSLLWKNVLHLLHTLLCDSLVCSKSKIFSIKKIHGQLK